MVIQRIVFVFMAVSLSMSIDAQILNPELTFELNRALQQKSKSTVQQWQADSTKAVQSNIPLHYSANGIDYSFIGYDGDLPLYAASATSSEIGSYLGDDLWDPPYDVRGQGQVVGMWEAGGAIPNTADDNLQTNGVAPARVSAMDAGPSTSHANNVVWRLAGDGSGVSPKQGIAPLVNVKAWNSAGVLSELGANAATLLASNHSRSYTCGWNTTEVVSWFSETNVSAVEDYKFGRYSDNDEEMDDIAYLNPYHSIVFSAGNDRGNTGSDPATAYNTVDNGANYTTVNVTAPPPQKDGGVDGYDCIPWGAIGKNMFTIGACAEIVGGYFSPSDVVVWTGTNEGSSWGPTDDGRIKPDFVAASTYKTSGSAPQATGSIALLQELSLRERGSYLWSSTIKALLIQTAFEAGPNPGPDFMHGWGLINPKGAADIILGTSYSDQIVENSLANSATDFYFAYSDGINPIVATLSWTDPKGSALARQFDATDLNDPTPMLVNDLDVRLKDVALANTDMPYIIDKTNINYPANAASQGDNVVDNSEKIVQATPAAGWYFVEVSHKGALASPQNYSLVLSEVKNQSCAADAASVIDNIWDGSVWSNPPFVSGQNAVITGNLTLATHHTFGNLLINSGVEITVNTSVVCSIEGDVFSAGGVSFLGDGMVEMNGSSAQVLCGGGTFSNLTLDNASGATLQNKEWKVSNVLNLQSGALTTNDLLTLSATVGNYAQIHEVSGSINGNITYQQVVSGASGWRHISSPVSTTVMDALEETNFYTLTGSGGSIQQWDAATGDWVPPASEASAFTATTSYTMFFGFFSPYTFSTLPHTLALTGPVNTGAVDNNVVFGPTTIVSNGDGWNLIANPYPENLLWSTIVANFGGLNINGSYYVWDANAGSYKTHNGSTGDVELGGSIAPMQSFFAQIDDLAAEATIAFDFTNANRTLAKASFLKTVPPYVVLKANQESRTDNFYVAFESGYSIEFELDKDAYKLFSPLDDIPQLYQQNPQDSFGMAMNWVNDDFDSFSIPIAYKNTLSGPASISLDLNAINTDWSFELEDLKTKNRHDLRQGNYLFSHKSSNNANRFILHINKTALQVADGGLSFAAWGNENRMHVRVNRTLVNGRIEVFNLVGQRLFEKQFETLNEESFPFIEAGVFLVRITTADGVQLVERVVN